MIDVKNLTKRFGARTAVQDVRFQVEPGTVLGFLGPNGAGKSTTLRMVTGFLAPSSGTAVVCGHDIREAPLAARASIGYLPENAPSYPDMTVSEFLSFIARMRGFRGAVLRQRVQEILERCFLTQVRHQVIDTLSKGYRQRTCLAQALLHNPPVLVLDEPTDGLDPNQKAVVREMIRGMAAEKAILLSTHVLEEVEALCTRVVIISGGRLVLDSTPGALRDQGGLEQSFRRLTTTEDTRAA